MLLPKRSDLVFHLTILFCILSAVTTIGSFVLYIRARTAARDEYPGHTPEQHARRLAELDRREQRYQTLHFITLFVFFLLGVLILIQLSNRASTI